VTYLNRILRGLQLGIRLRIKILHCGLTDCRLEG
jgi:hypothetical protein